MNTKALPEPLCKIASHCVAKPNERAPLLGDLSSLHNREIHPSLYENEVLSAKRICCHFKFDAL